MRDHDPVVIDDFNGFFARGDFDSCPIDHFPDCNNVAYIESGVRTRDGYDTFYGQVAARLYSFNQADNSGFIVLDTAGNFYHIIPGIPSSFKFLTVAGADDFFMLNFDNRVYINPIKKGASLNDHLYVYLGDSSTPARPAGGAHPVAADGAITASLDGPGNVEAGIHVFGVIYQTDTGFQTAPSDTLATVLADDAHAVTITLPTSPNSYVKKVQVVASKLIDPTLYTGDPKQYELFLVPGAIVDNGTSSIVVNFYDAELLTSAAGLFDLKDSIPNGIGALGMYHGRMTLIGQQDTSDPDIVWISNIGEPEAFNAVSGFITLPHDGLGISAAQEYRDILYIFKINDCFAYSDNGDVPASWPQSEIEGRLGCSAHGVAVVRQNNSLDIEYLLVLNLDGLFIFQGLFSRPTGELTYKIKDFWVGSPNKQPWNGMDINNVAYNYQVMNDGYNQLIYISLPDLKMILVGDYAKGMDPQNIRWAKWTTDIRPSTIAMYGKENTLIIGSDGT